MTINNSFMNIPLERKEEIRDVAISMNAIVSDYFSTFRKYISIEERVNKGYTLYRKYYKSSLTEAEKNIFYLYLIFPDDNYFYDLIKRYNYDYQQIGVIYNVPGQIVKARNALQKNIMIERSFADFKTKKKTMN